MVNEFQEPTRADCLSLHPGPSACLGPDASGHKKTTFASRHKKSKRCLCKKHQFKRVKPKYRAATLLSFNWVIYTVFNCLSICLWASRWGEVVKYLTRWWLFCSSDHEWNLEIMQQQNKMLKPQWVALSVYGYCIFINVKDTLEPYKLFPTS